uniref:ORF2 n=1 Tax=Torque teno Leptonychotes weddellii virus-2 TaxID=2012677 RepID=A0A1Z2RWE0_9VIRU|nr:ORF2 [Torque teno Leptonychotes weddellii virus-2]WCS65892.1 ORF2 [Torque teno Leptonychotes weddellii virus 2]ASA48898.1 ORF2 [Torque teno Leptonychotes weddellii virus-2]ASA48922.1 ORF2 [Torque teno Leptonychotes weddellii virus-2]WCS65896.1 ORF2 [Torque teno Leptonychotes weddellii virus 2]
MSSTADSIGGPDLRHPLGYRKAEAVWKRLISREHTKFCSCGSYINHFRWPGTGGDGEKDPDTGEEQGSGAGDVSIIGATGGGDTGGDGDISDHVLLR